MSNVQEVLEKTTQTALSGELIYVEPLKAIQGLEWKTAGALPDGVEHSIFQLVAHMTYWQNWGIEWLKGKNPQVPKHASSSWLTTERPSRRRDWEQAVKRFADGLGELRRLSQEIDLVAKRQKWSSLEMFMIVALHNSYHTGQVVLIRQMLDLWPPPSGGVTW
jgi:uncharacterized damage-inducible protein DinB